MPKLAWSVVVIFSVSFFVMVLGLASGPTAGTAVISGTVRNEKGSALNGVLVRLINTDRQVSVSVITQGGGRYRVDSLFPGTYEVRAERKGYETSVKGGLKVDTRASVDLVLKKREGSAGYLSIEDLPAQFPDDPDRALVFDTCFQCHAMSATVHKRKDRAGWEKTIRRMAPNRGRTEKEVVRLINYFERHFNTDRPVPPPFRTEPEPSLEEANVRITEYKIPDQGTARGVSDYNELGSGSSMLDRVSLLSWNDAPIYPHNITVTPEGIVWFVMFRANNVGRLDPRSGEFRSYPVPTPGSVPHGIDWALDGSIWFTELRGNKVGRINPKTGDLREFSAPGGNSIIKDSKGNMYWTAFGTNQIGQINTKTFEITAHDLLTPKSNPYGIVVDQKDQVWWCQMNVDKIGKLDPKTGKITEYSTPKLSAPRRISVDSKGNIWFTEWRTSKVGKLDPATGKITEYALPTENSSPYELMVDAEDTVWVAGFQSNTLAHLDPATGKFVEYPLPTPKTEIRKMYADPKQGVWFSGSHTDTIGHIMVKQ